MMRRGLLAVVFLCAAAVAVQAQVQASAETTRSTFLLYERVDVLVTLTNIGNTDLVLNNDEGRPWLGFMVSGETVQHNFLPVHTERQSNFAGLTLKQGETKTLRVNITPLYEMRLEGNYRVSAVVDLPGQSGQLVTDPASFSVQQGHVVTSAMRVIDTMERDYSLIRFSPTPQDTSLYLRVEAPNENTVYANLALGPLVSSVDPTLLFDPQGNVHVLQPMALGTYLYTRTNSEGKVLAQRLFKSTVDPDSGGRVRPRLIKTNDGSVIIQGGLSEDPTRPREKLSDSQHGQKMMAPAAPDPDLSQRPSQQHSAPAPDATPAASESAPTPPADSDASPSTVGDPGTAAKSSPAPIPSPSTVPPATDMPPAK